MAKNTAPNPPTVAQDEFDEETELSSFPPYWQPTVGSQVDVIVGGLDTRDPKFPRFVFQSAQDSPFEAFRGASENPESVAVQPGELFSCSTYAGLFGVEEYAGLKIRIKCTGTRKTGQPNPMLVFKIATTPETRRIHAERKAANAFPAIPLSKVAALNAKSEARA